MLQQIRQDLKDIEGHIGGPLLFRTIDCQNVSASARQFGTGETRPASFLDKSGLC